MHNLKERMWQKRLQRVLVFASVALIGGVSYGVFVQKTGIAVPCMLYLQTGLKCPGCGVTRMCVALMQLDFESAFAYNQALFLLTPALAVVFAKYIADYIRTGKWKLARWQTYILYASIAVLAVFGILRNIL